MRKPLTFFLALATADVVSITLNVFRKYFNNGPWGTRFFIKELGRSLFDRLSQSEKLGQAGAAFRALRSRELVERGIADLTQHHLPAVQHGKLEGQPFRLVPYDRVTDQRHGQHSPQTGAGSPRLPQPASQINGLTATLSRKLLLFLIALASIAFGVCSPAAAQIALVPGQVNFNFSFASVTSLSVSPPNNPTAGNLVGVCFALNDPGAHTPVTIQDGDGNNYTPTTSTPYIVSQSGNVFNLGIGFLQNAPAPISNSKTITVIWTGAVGGTAIWAAEFSGAATSAVLEGDNPSRTATASASITAPSITTVNNRDLLLNCASGSGGSMAVGSPWTEINGSYCNAQAALHITCNPPLSRRA